MYLQSAPCTGGVEKKRVSAKLYLPSLQASGVSHWLCKCRLAVQVRGAQLSLPGHHFTSCRHQCDWGSQFGCTVAGMQDVRTVAMAGPDAVRTARRCRHDLIEHMLAGSKVIMTGTSGKRGLFQQALVVTTPQSTSRGLPSRTVT